MKIALAMIVAGTDEEAQLLDRCLDSVDKYVDGIFITSTYKKGKEPNKKVENVVKKYKGKLSTFEWVNDFATARNFSFAQVPKEYDYIMWCDADDVWTGLEKLRATIEHNNTVDAFTFDYVYDSDEYGLPRLVHQKTQIVRNDGCVEWAGEIHEDFRHHRELHNVRVDGIVRVHLTNEKRVAVNAERNLEIARSAMTLHKDDPRSYWNMANALVGVNKLSEAKEQFNLFIERSRSDDEIYVATTRLASIEKALGNIAEATKLFQIAIGMRPHFPDAYFNLGYHLIDINRLDDAEMYILFGLKMKVPYHELMLFNPREYDYIPMMSLVKIYFAKGRPDLALPTLLNCKKIYPQSTKLNGLIDGLQTETKRLEQAVEFGTRADKMSKEEVIKEIDAMDIDIKSHPLIRKIYNSVNIKTTSTGKDIAYYCGYTKHEWNAEMAKTKGVGGSEEAVINLAKQWKEMGYNVTVYCNCGTHALEVDGVKYEPYWFFNPKSKVDYLIMWRSPRLADYEINATKMFVDLHDVVQEGEFNEKRLAKIEKIFVKTKFHRSLFPKIPDEKFVIIPNGQDFGLFEQDVKKDPYLLVNTSSPDRSMDVLPKLFKKVKERVPQARLKWAYGFDIFNNNNSDDKVMMDWSKKCIADMEEAGIENMGRLSQKEVAKLYLEGRVLAYPSEFAEIDCYPKNTRILTDKGDKYIQDLTLKDSVVTHTGNIKPVTMLMAKKHSSVIDFDVQCGDSFYVSPEHPLYVKRGNVVDFVKASNVKQTDKLLFPRKINSIPYTQIPIRYIKTSGGFEPNESREHIVINDTIARFLGYFAGDGNASTVTGKINVLVADAHPEHIKIAVDGFRAMGYEPKTLKQNGCTQYYIHSHALARAFKDEFYIYGEKTLPLGLLHFDSVLDGLVASDGSFNGYNYTFTNKSKYLIGYVRSALAKRGFYAKVTSRVHKNGNLSYSMTWTQDRLCKFYNVTDDFIELKIKSIAPRVTDEWLYNLEVADDNSYIANGHITHNCISVKKAQACGCTPITTDFGAFAESVQYGTKVSSPKTKDTWCLPYQFTFGISDEATQQAWVDAVVEELSKPMSDNAEMKEWSKRFSWDKIAKQWINQL